MILIPYLIAVLFAFVWVIATFAANFAMIIDFDDLVGSSSVSCAIQIDGFAQLRMMGARPMMMPGCCGGCPGAMPPNSSGEGEGGNPAGASQGTTSNAKCRNLNFQVLFNTVSYNVKSRLLLLVQRLHRYGASVRAGKLTFHSRLISIEDHPSLACPVALTRLPVVSSGSDYCILSELLLHAVTVA